VGYGKTRKQVLAIVEGVARDKEVLKKIRLAQVGGESFWKDRMT